MYRCSCLCGSVEFTILGDIHSVRYCYCVHCRKFAGTSPATWAMAESARLARATADAPVARYHSGSGDRCFCPRCGSALWFESSVNPQIVAIPLGVIDDGHVPAPSMHIWTRSKPGWCAINDSMPQYETNPEPDS